MLSGNNLLCYKVKGPSLTNLSLQLKPESPGNILGNLFCNISDSMTSYLELGHQNSTLSHQRLVQQHNDVPTFVFNILLNESKHVRRYLPNTYMKVQNLNAQGANLHSSLMYIDSISYDLIK